VSETAANPNVEQTDILYAQMEVFLDISASAALATEETSRGDFIDVAVESFDSMMEIAIEDHLDELAIEVDALPADLGEKNNKTLN